MNRSSKIYVAGHSGMVGSAVLSRLEEKGYTNLVFKRREELDLRNQEAVHQYMGKERPQVIINAAARVGGILANDRYPWQFLYDNLAIQTNLIAAAHEQGVEKFIFLGSSCIYPKHADQPLKEECLLTGALEPTNQWYTVAKITGIKLCQALREQYNRHYISLLPANLYGTGDNFDLETSHVLPALIRKFHEAKRNSHAPVTLWGTGLPRREFLHVDDLSNAVLYALENRLDQSMYNVGTGKDITVQDLALLIQDIVGHQGNIQWDTSKPDGTPQKLLDVGRLTRAGWEYSIELEEGIKKTYEWFLDHRNELREVKYS